jgi:arylsulfatase A-like enzyme
LATSLFALVQISLMTLPAPVRTDTEPERPNILIVLTDDQPVEDSLTVMPNVRALFRAGGTRFPNGFVTTPLCCPSRSTILSGRYAHNHGVTGNGGDGSGGIGEPTGQPDPKATIEKYLHDGGYKTAIAGKFLVNLNWSTNPPYWDRWAITGGGYYDEVGFNLDGHAIHLAGDYSTSVVGDKSVEYLKAFDRAADSSPWFLYVAPHAPHADYTPARRFEHAPVGRWQGNPAAKESDRSDKPPWVRWHTFDWEKEGRRLRAAQLRTLLSVDRQVGRIYRTIDALGEQNTLAFFLSDNGLLWGEHGIGGDKRFPYSGSVGVPFFARWPGHIAQGVTDRSLVANVDLLPTILDAAQLDPPLRYPLDGRPLLASNRKRLLLEYFVSPDSSLGGWAATRTRRYEYVEWFADEARSSVSFREYYDLKSDPWQLTNLYRDGVTSNDPPTPRLHRRLRADMGCAGANCP